MWVLSILVASLAICHSHGKSGDLIIETDSGTVEGWERLARGGRLYQAWTAIPYAEPPVGALRFKSPKPKASWKGVLNATGDAPQCVQAAGSSTSEIAGSEDCLYLSVYRPKIERKNLPVIFHVHGGAFQGGFMGPREVADYLMDEDIVFVALQYRLNAFGFMTLGDSVMPGNFGLKDQVLALKWVKRNIAKFGGNPHSVTVLGESAGAGSTHILLKSPATDGLVHRAMSDSGTINRFWSLMNPNHIKSHTLLIAKKCGCMSEKSGELLKCLQNVDASTIMTQSLANGIDPSIQLFMPVIEPKEVKDAIATFDLSLRPCKKPWIASVATGEWALFKSMMMEKKFPADIKKYLIDYLSVFNLGLTKNQILEAAKVLEKFYFSSAGPNMNPVDQQAKLEADLSFIYPAMKNIALHQGPKWIYRYEYVSDMTRNILRSINITEEIAYHASQMGNYLNLGRQDETPEGYAVSKRIIKYIVNFAYHNNPTPGPSAFKWKQFRKNEILRVTKLGDFYADQKIVQQMADVVNLWDTVVGWKK